jgi:hypothetical protein
MKVSKEEVVMSGIYRCLLGIALLVFVVLPAQVVADPRIGDRYTLPAKGSVECTSTVMNEIAAAFNTQGYWVLDDLVHQIGEFNLGLWAPFLYIFVVFFGLIQMAMGMPPRTYMWWIFGPIIYDWLLFTPVEEARKGVCWNVGTSKQTQAEVWRLAEVGFVNLNDIENRAKGYSIEKGPNEGARYIPMVFAWFDDLISDQIEFLVAWSGITRQIKNPNGTTYMHNQPSSITSKSDGDVNPWAILTNSKWPMLEDITASTLHNADLREALSRFMASECGDKLSEFIDKGAYASSGAARGVKLPESVFVDCNGATETIGGNAGYKKILNALKTQWVPYPEELKRMLYPVGKDESGSFVNFSSATKQFSEVLTKDTSPMQINCAQFLYLIMQGFRWESGHAYNQVIARASEHKLTAEVVTYDFLYGWRIGKENSVSLTIKEQQQFVQNLILLYMMRNEFRMVTAPADRKYTSSERAENYVNLNAATVGSKNKFGELYMWAKLMPYMQGVALYFLSAMYPFACMLMIIPGWHKVILTWMGFYAWAKSWDAGFAVVMSLERNIWAMVGNTHDAAEINERVYQQRLAGTIKLQEGVTDAGGTCDMPNLVGCLIPDVIDQGEVGAEGDTQAFTSAIRTFDYGMLLTSRLDLDLANAYYIYLMSALYFAVPAVTGQILLGAKAGIAGMLTQGVSGVAQQTGSGAGMGYQGELSTDTANNQAVASQEGFAKSLRNGGFAQRALEAGSASAKTEQTSAGASAMGSLVGVEQGMNAQNWDMHDAALKNVVGAVTGVVETGQDVKNKVGNKKAPTPPSSGSSVVGGGAGGGAGGGVGGGVGGVGGGAASTGLQNTADQILQHLKASAGGQSWPQIFNTGLRAAAAGAGAGIAYGKGQSSFAFSKDQADYTASGAIAGAESRLVGFQSGRYGEVAQQAAAEKQWVASRRLGRQMAGTMSAMGIFPNSFTAGPKPTSVNGMLGLGMGDTTSWNAVKQGDFYGFGVQGEYNKNVGQISGYKDQIGETAGYFTEGANFKGTIGVSKEEIGRSFKDTFSSDDNMFKEPTGTFRQVEKK